jgi:hypothetical protein
MIISIILTLFLAIPFLSFYNLTNSTANAQSNWIQTSYNDFGKGTMDNVTTIGTGSDITLELLSLSQWIDTTKTLKPEGRIKHPMVPIYNNDKMVLLFGGSDSSETYGDTWVYESSVNIWTKLTPINSPGPTSTHEMAAIYGTDKVIMFDSTSLQTWEFDYGDNNWKNKSPTTYPTMQNHQMASIYNTDKVLLFGGSSGVSPLNETWVYDLDSNLWMKQYPAVSPKPRTDHSMAMIYGTDKVLLYGGMNFGTYLSDTWIYDLSDNIWTQQHTSITPGYLNQPDMATIYDSNNVVIYGIQSSGWNTVTYVYDVDENVWKDTTMTTNPIRRGRAQLAMIPGTNRVVLFGGLYGSYYQDTWEFIYGFHNQGTFISTKYNCKYSSIIKTISWDASVPDGTEIKFQIRSGNSFSGLDSEYFYGPNGVVTSYYINSPSTIWVGHSNHQYVQYKVTMTSDGLNTPILDQVNITFNNLPETKLTSPANGALVGGNKPIFKWKFSDEDSVGQQEFQVLIDDDPNFLSVEFNSLEQTSDLPQWQFPQGTGYFDLPDGTWYWKARTMDTDGDWGLFSDHFMMTVDLTIGRPRYLMVTPGEWTSKNSFTVSWENPLDLSKIVGAYYKIGSAPVSDTDGIFVEGENISKIEDISLNCSGNIIIYVWLMDGAGNVDSASFSNAIIYYDCKAPGVPENVTVAPSYWTSKNSFSIDWTPCNDHTGVKTGIFYYFGNQPPYSEADGTWTAEKPLVLESIAQGEKTCYLWLEDNLGNKNCQNYFACTLLYDATSPNLQQPQVTNNIEGEPVTN